MLLIYDLCDDINLYQNGRDSYSIKVDSKNQLVFDPDNDEVEGYYQILKYSPISKKELEVMINDSDSSNSLIVIYDNKTSRFSDYYLDDSNDLDILSDLLMEMKNLK